MSVAATQSAVAFERRRSPRFPLALPLTVHGASLDGKSFNEDTFTLSVSAHGALVMLATTVTLGQKLRLRNPQTQEETEAWVTRFGVPRGGMAHAGIEFVRTANEFWPEDLGAKIPAAEPEPIASESLAPEPISPEQRSEQQIHVLPQKESTVVPVEELTVDGETPVQPLAAAPSAEASTEASAESSAAAAPPDTLQRWLEQTLQQAADKVVTATATERLGSVVRHATATIEDFTNAKIADVQELLSQAQQHLVSTAHDEFISRSRDHVAQTEEYLQKRTAEFLQQSTQQAHDAFAEKLSETAKVAVAQFAAQHLARLSEHVQTAISAIHQETVAAVSTLGELHEKSRTEMERAAADAAQKTEFLDTRNKEAHLEWETRLREFQDELSRRKEEQVEEYVQRLRCILTSLLTSLG